MGVEMHSTKVKTSFDRDIISSKKPGFFGTWFLLKFHKFLIVRSQDYAYPNEEKDNV